MQQLKMLMTMKGWAFMAFAVVIIALLGWIDIGTAFYAVIALTALGIFVFQLPSVVPILQFAVSLLVLILLSGGVGAFSSAVIVSPISAVMIAGGG
jgi:hypothetical protein